jgi:F-type H+-transporting ATPase subunit delta
MLENIIARRYAQAFWEVARDKGKEEVFFKALKTLADALGKEKLIAFWKSPLFEEAEKLAVLDKALSALSLPGEVANFAQLLVRKERLFLIQEITQEFERIYQKDQGLAQALVYSPYPLLKRQTRELAKTLSGLTGKKISIETRIDKTLLGGVVIHIGNLVLDGSIKGRLRRFAQSIG